MLTIEPHPLLDLRAFVTCFPQSLDELAATEELAGLLSLDTSAPFCSSDEIRLAVRDLLRHGGFKPTGRSKPASEYLIKAATGSEITNINVAVDACNAVSLHSGLPISVIDLQQAIEPLRLDICPAGTSYIFNPSGQTMDVGGLLCLFDSEGACANAVKDSQRTKTSGATTRTLSLIWGTHKLPDRSEQVATWYQDLLRSHGATIQPIGE